MEYLKLGASLYVPAVRNDLADIAIGAKYPQLRSIIIDTEDSVAEDQLPIAYDNIQQILVKLHAFEKHQKPLLFLRVRNPVELRQMLNMPGIENIDGFVLPKFCKQNMHLYLSILPQKFWYMPILEKDIFTEEDLHAIRNFLLQHKANLLSVRIGITDILNTLHTRRSKTETIYTLPVASHIISRIAFAFAPYDINITGVVWEYWGKGAKEALQKEVYADLENGLFGKSAIHPEQIETIQDAYKVSIEEIEAAIRIVSETTLAVFSLHDTMQERATHINWAKKIIARKNLYGIREEKKHFSIY